MGRMGDEGMGEWGNGKTRQAWETSAYAEAEANG